MKDNINENELRCFSQERKILYYMLRGNHITGIEALELFGCFRLPARIADIRKRGFTVNSQSITLKNGKRVKDYWIEDKYKVTL